MTQAADLAFRQSLAMCAVSPEVVFRYGNLLLQIGRLEDALLIARTAAKLNPSDPNFERLTLQLEHYKGGGERKGKSITP